MSCKSKRASPVRQCVLWLLKDVGNHEQMAQLLANDDSIIPEEIWHDMAFYLVNIGELELLQSLVHHRRVPLRVVDARQRTLLHMAVARGQFETAEWLLKVASSHYGDPDLFEWWLTARTNRGRSAMDIAVKSGRMELVGLLLDDDNCIYLSEVRELLERVMHEGNDRANEWIMAQIRAFELERMVDDSLEVLKEKAKRFEWWQDCVENGWTDIEQDRLFELMGHAAQEGKVEVIDWLLTECGMTLNPPSSPILLSCKSIADRAYLRSGRLLKALQKEESGKKSRDGARIRSIGWNGDITTLREAIARVFRKYPKLWKSNPKYEMLMEKHWRKALQVVQYVASRYQRDGPVCLPRLDLLVMTGQLHIVRWFAQHGFFDLNQRLAAPDVEEDADCAMGDRNVCAICLGLKSDRHHLDCAHWFCGGCLRQIQQMTAHHRFRCPLCRRSATVPKHVAMVGQMLDHLQKERPWFKFDVTMILKDVMAGFATATGSVFILDWLIKEHGVDPRTLRFGGETMMHLAIRRGHSVVVKYLSALDIDLLRVVLEIA